MKLTRYSLITLALASTLSLATTLKLDTISVIPKPAQMTTQSGEFVLTADTSILVASTKGLPLGKQLAAYLKTATGYTLVVSVGAQADNAICL